MGTMWIMRGVPGSGKTHKAEQIKAEHQDAMIYSTDDFFMVDGRYTFNPKKLPEYHAANQKRARTACQNGVGHVIIDNTHVQAWEAREYVRAAMDYGYRVRFVEADTPWAKDAEVCAARNQHGVPLDAIKRMLSNWQESLTVEKCLAAKAPWEK